MENSSYCNNMRIIAIILLLLVVIDEFYVKVYSIWDVIGAVIEYFSFKDYITTFSSLVVTILAILYLSLGKPKDLSKIMTVCVTVIAYDSMIDAYIMLVEYKELLNDEMALIKVVLFLEGSLNLVVSLMLFINAFIYARGLSKSTTLIKYSVYALLGLVLLMMVIDFRSGQTIMDVLENNRDTMPLVLILIFVLVIVNSKSVKLRTTMYTITSSIGDLRNSMAAMGIGIERGIALRLSDYNRKGLWCDSYSFILTTFYKDDYIMTLEKCDGNVLARISSVDNHTGVNNFRFHVSGIWSDTGDIRTCDLMRFYGEEGLFIQLIVRDSEVHPKSKVPRIGSIILSSREPDTRSHRILMKAVSFKHGLKESIGKIKANTVGGSSEKKE